MSTSPPAVGNRPGLSNVVDIIIAPNAAFARLREVPTWGWAYLVVVLLGIAGALLVMPGVMHAMQTSIPAQLATNPGIMKLPADQRDKAIQNGLKFALLVAQFSWVFVPIGVLLVGLLQGLIMLVFNAVGKGDGSFKKYFALSVTVGIVGYGLASLATGIIVMLRGSDSFESTVAIQQVVPSLALLAPGASKVLTAFLAIFNVFTIWATVLTAYGMTVVGRVSRAPAWTAALAMLVLTALFAAWGASRS
ncbi:MAG: YIP1 family protein [Candidatus Eremiobacteraeota bacterium]|nr:YIP1 family protein [Candidatus Eremiobacteraeota bacterium]MBV9408016.1 YIP1 family protein [Candidatus Eremiobacteraeota bacterium]